MHKCGFLSCGLPADSTDIPVDEIGQHASAAVWRGVTLSSSFVACDTCRHLHSHMALRWERLNALHATASAPHATASAPLSDYARAGQAAADAQAQMAVVSDVWSDGTDYTPQQIELAYGEHVCEQVLAGGQPLSTSAFCRSVLGISEQHFTPLSRLAARGRCSRLRAAIVSA